MRIAGLLILILCFLITCCHKSLAFWWGSEQKEAQVLGVEQTSKPDQPEKIEDKESAESARLQDEEAKRLAEQEKKAQEEAIKAEAWQKLNELKQANRDKLNNTEWEIELNSLTSQGKSPDRDIITFKDNQISSANLSRIGFAPTNYTLTIHKNGSLTCETMQSSGKGGIAFWRAEIDANMEKMQGILSHRINNKTSRDYSFLSITKKVVEPSSGE